MNTRADKDKDVSLSSLRRTKKSSSLRDDDDSINSYESVIPLCKYLIYQCDICHTDIPDQQLIEMDYYLFHQNCMRETSHYGTV